MVRWPEEAELPGPPAHLLNDHHGSKQPVIGNSGSMPVVIEKEKWLLWLGEAEGDPISLLRAAPDDVLRVWPVDKQVGDVRNDRPELLEPRQLDDAPLLSPIKSSYPRAAGNQTRTWPFSRT